LRFSFAARRFASLRGDDNRDQQAPARHSRLRRREEAIQTASAASAVSGVRELLMASKRPLLTRGDVIVVIAISAGFIVRRRRQHRAVGA
jgi:hypothetical protein